MTAGILIVDDDRVAASMLEKLLIKQGYQVFKAGDGATGYELARQHKPALVICDMLLPKIHGIDLCKKIKEDPELKNVKVILITAVYKRAATESDLKSWGADGYFEKPINTQRLLAWIENNFPKQPQSQPEDKKRLSSKQLDVDEIMSQLEALVDKDLNKKK